MADGGDGLGVAVVRHHRRAGHGGAGVDRLGDQELPLQAEGHLVDVGVDPAEGATRPGGGPAVVLAVVGLALVVGVDALLGLVGLVVPGELVARVAAPDQHRAHLDPLRAAQRDLRGDERGADVGADQHLLEDADRLALGADDVAEARVVLLDRGDGGRLVGGQHAGFGGVLVHVGAVVVGAEREGRLQREEGVGVQRQPDVRLVLQDRPVLEGRHVGGRFVEVVVVHARDDVPVGPDRAGRDAHLGALRVLRDAVQRGLLGREVFGDLVARDGFGEEGRGHQGREGQAVVQDLAHLFTPPAQKPSFLKG